METSSLSNHFPLSNMAEGKLKKMNGLTSQRTCFLRKASLEKIQFHLPFRKCRQDSGEIKKNIYSSRKLKVAAGGWKAAGRRGMQECLVRCHSKGKSAQILCWVVWLQLLWSSKSCCCQLKGIMLDHFRLCFLSQIWRTRDPHIFCCFLSMLQVLAHLHALSPSV